ncbi:MAG: damage-control phosphatase ARMT1 family protein [Candidatus Bathyarchaeia archaeon]
MPKQQLTHLRKRDVLKIRFECPCCLLNRAYVEIGMATENPILRLRTIHEVMKAIVDNFTPEVTPAYMGTLRDRTIKKRTENPDPFKNVKIASNKKALELLPLALNYISKSNSTSERFRRACLMSIVGNAFEFGIKDYMFDYNDLPKLIWDAEKNLQIDQIREIESAARGAESTLLLTDNAGEIVFDKILVEELKRIGLYVTVAVKATPVSNDATIEDALMVNMDQVADKVITTGADSLGLNIPDCSKDFLDVYSEAELVIAKGMAHYETLTEHSLRQLHAVLLKAKCRPIASDLGVKLGGNVAKLL